MPVARTSAKAPRATSIAAPSARRAAAASAAETPTAMATTQRAVGPGLSDRALKYAVPAAASTYVMTVKLACGAVAGSVTVLTTKAGSTVASALVTFVSQKRNRYS